MPGLAAGGCGRLARSRPRWPSNEVRGTARGLRARDGRRARCRPPPRPPGCRAVSAARTGPTRGAPAVHAAPSPAALQRSSTPATRHLVWPPSAHTNRPSPALPHACAPPAPPVPNHARSPAWALPQDAQRIVLRVLTQARFLPPAQPPLPAFNRPGSTGRPPRHRHHTQGLDWSPTARPKSPFKSLRGGRVVGLHKETRPERTLSDGGADGQPPGPQTMESHSVLLSTVRGPPRGPDEHARVSRHELTSSSPEHPAGAAQLRPPPAAHVPAASRSRLRRRSTRSPGHAERSPPPRRTRPPALFRDG